MTEDENDDPVGPGPRDPRAAFAAVAVRVGLIREGDPIDQNLLDFAAGVVELCASIGDRYRDEDCDGNAGEHIRAELLD